MPWGIRTLDLLLRRQLLYPTELKARIGASDGNRTHAASLEGWNSTIELHSHMRLENRFTIIAYPKIFVKRIPNIFFGERKFGFFTQNT